MIVLDAGPLIALFDGFDRYHAAAVDFIRRTRQPLVTNAPVLAEACRRGSPRFSTGIATRPPTSPMLRWWRCAND